MKVKKVGKIITGAQLTSDENKAIDIEIQKHMAEINRKNSNEIDAMFLWYLHTKYGHGHSRLRQDHRDFKPMVEELCRRYEMETDDDKIYLFTKKLLDYGVDIAAWNEELAKEV
jgi:hypothetical protein